MPSISNVSDLLVELVSIPSINPRLKGADSLADEAKLADYIKEQLRLVGIDVELQEVECGRHNVIGHISRGPFGKHGIVLLCSHMDTYPPVDAQQLKPTIEGTRLYGRGSADAKGPLASMMYAFMQAADSRYRRETYFVASIDEEYGLLGAKTLSNLRIRPDLAITGEPTSLIPVVAQKGIIRTCITIAGEESHAAYPKPQNAILDAGKLVNGIKCFNEELVAEFGHPRLTPSTVVPTRLLSDGDMNLTPSEVVIWLDARFLPGVTAEEFLARLETYLQGYVEDEVDWKVASPGFVSPPNDCPLSNLLVADFLKCITSVTGRSETETFSYGSEAGYLAEFSTASLVFGPGDAKYSHSDNEVVELRQVEDASEIYTHLLTGHRM